MKLPNNKHTYATMEDNDDSSLVLADDDDDDASVDDSNYKEWNLDEDILNRLKQNDP